MGFLSLKVLQQQLLNYGSDCQWRGMLMHQTGAQQSAFM